LAALSAFSPQANLFAFLSLAIDKHRLRVYDTVTGKSIAEHVVDSARITTLIWGQIDLSEQPPASVDEDASSTKKRGKRKRLSANSATENARKPETEVVVLGLSDGTLLFFSPTHNRVLRTLSHSTNVAAILSIVLTDGGDKGPIVWTSGADGAIRLWNARQNNITSSWKIDDRIPYSFMSVRPGAGEEDRVDFLVANHGIRLLSSSIGQPDSSPFESLKPKVLASFTGHASSIRCLQWDASQKPSSRFLSMADSDRFIYVWDVPTGASTEGKIVLSIPLDSNVRHISLSIPPTPHASSTPGKQSILALSSSGRITVYPIPSELTPPASSEKTKHKVPTLLPRSIVNVSSKKASSAAQIVDASFIPDKEGQIKVARVVGGVRPVFSIAVSSTQLLKCIGL
jgi:U3 small nucleolar RNA-associated protein 5